MFRFFEKSVPPFPDTESSQPPIGLWAFTWHYAKPFRFLLLGLLITSGLIAALEAYLFAMVGQLVDWMVASADPEAFFSEHKTSLIVFMVLVLLIWPLVSYLDSLLEHQGLLGNFSMQIRWRSHRYLLRQSSQFFSNDFAGRLATKVMQTALSVRDSVVIVNGLLVYVVVYFIATLGIFLSNDWRLGIPLIGWLILYGLIMRYFLPRLQKVSTEQSDARSLMTGRVVDAYTNIQTVKMFSSSNAEEDYAKDSMSEMLVSVYDQMRLVTQLTVVMIISDALLICTTVGFGIWLWSQGFVSPGAVAVAGALTLRLQAMGEWFIWELERLFEAIGTTQDGLNTIAQPISVNDDSTADDLQVSSGAIEYDRVSFHYGKESGVIDELSLSIKPGERVGLVGHSGAGKSTLVNLLLRFYDTEHGVIRIDGQDIASVNQESLRRQIAVVSQDTSLMHRSIRENVAYSKPDATESEVMRAIKFARADEFIFNMIDHEGNKGLDAQVGERGVKLSGGQRQRIAIARVILKDAPILVLDEATSALDSEVEFAIQEQLNGLMQDKTVIAIAHRLSTIAKLDRIIIIQDGRIAEQGSHQELLEQHGIYERLWQQQSGGFLGQ